MLKKLVLLVVVLGAAGLFAAEQDEPVGDDFAVTMEKVNETDTEATVLCVGSWGVGGVQGWSFGMKHDPAKLSIGDCGGQTYSKCDNDCDYITCPEAISTIKEGSPPQYLQIGVYDDGVTCGLVIDFMGQVKIAATERFELLQVKYDIAETPADVSYTGEIGSPPVATVWTVAGNSYTPATQEGVTIGEGEPPPPCELTFSLDKKTEDGEEKAAVLIESAEDQAIEGFQFGLQADSADVTVSSVVPGADLLANCADSDGDGEPEPDFFGVNKHPGDNGVTLGVALSLEEPFKALPACTEDMEVAVVGFVNSSDAEVTTEVSFTGELGDPVVPLAASVEDESFSPKVGAPVSVIVPPAVVVAPFIRGDANQDGMLTVSDGIAIAKYVFDLGTKKDLIAKCEDSADANDDGTIDTADAVYLLEYLFTGGDAVPAPLDSCGSDPTDDDELTCEEFACP